MYTYYISVGSNMGDKRGYISSAFQSLLHHEAISRLVTSPLIETEPWGYTEQDTFVNGVWSCESTLDPHQMLIRFGYYFSVRYRGKDDFFV